MTTIGLLGGVASGKSLVAKMLAEHGAGILDADRAGHEVLDDPEVQAALRTRWGESVFTPQGSPDRAAIAARVFGEGSEATNDRRFLEQLLHPRIGQRLQRQRDEMERAGVSAVVLDAPLLLEAEWDAMCDLLVFVDAPRETRLRRAFSRGWSEPQFSQREAAQWDIAVKRQRADAILPNGADPEQLRQHVQRFWDELVARRSR